MRTITGIRGFRVPREQVSTLDKVSKCHTGDRLLKELFHLAFRVKKGRRFFSLFFSIVNLFPPYFPFPFFASSNVSSVSAKRNIDKTEHSNGGFNRWMG